MSPGREENALPKEHRISWRSELRLRRVLVKLPGSEPKERRIATRDSAIRSVIGCTFETRAEWTDAGWGEITLLCANQETAQALGYPKHIWFHTGTIAGPVIVIKRLANGQYLDLTDEDVIRWTTKLREFEEVCEGYVHRAITHEEERAHRRQHSLGFALSHDDDLTAVLRLQLEIERRVRERILCKMSRPEWLGRSLRLELPQALAIAAGFEAIPHELVELITNLGVVRNSFAHEPGYTVTPPDIDRLKKFADDSGLDDTRWAFDQAVDETVHMSQESRDLRMIYNRVIVELDDEVIAMKACE